MYLLVEVLLVAAPFVLLGWIVDYRLNNFFPGIKELPAIDQRPARRAGADTPSAAAFATQRQRVYFITGGSGFLGAWVARYLILRGEANIWVLDTRKLPSDLLRHGIGHIKVDVADAEALAAAVDSVLERVRNPLAVVYHAAADVRHHDGWTMREGRSMKNAEMAKALVACFGAVVQKYETGPETGPKTDDEPRCVIINMGDTVQSRRPVSWWKVMGPPPWLQQTRSDTEAVDVSSPSRFVSLYAYSKALAEKCVLAANEGGGALVTSSVRVDGLLSGHYGDTLLTPALRYGGGLLHSWGVPLALVHVEDAVRAAVAVEHQLLDPASRSNVAGQAFSISGKDLTTLAHVYDYIRSSVPHFRPVRVQPVIVLLVSQIVSIRDLLFGSDYNTRRDNSLLAGAVSTFTPQRFSVLHIAQLSNPANAERARRLLGFEPLFNVRDCLDGILREQKIMESRRTV